MNPTAVMSISSTARAQLVPNGELRAGMNLSNALFTTQDSAGGELSGVSVDLMRALARALGVPLQTVIYPTPGDVADASVRGEWDVALLAIAHARAATIHFSQPLSEIDATYVVHADSPLTSVAEVDQPGVRISAPARAGYELHLTQSLRHATLVRSASASAAREVFYARQTDALAGLRPDLIRDMGELGDPRLLEGNFMTVTHGIGTPRPRGEAAAFLAEFVAQINANQFVAESIERHGVQGLKGVQPA